MEGILERNEVWGMFMRGVAMVYLISFCSISYDIGGIASSTGIDPIRDKLAAVSRDVKSPWKRFWFLPSLFWVLPTWDVLIRGFPLVGACLALLAIYGGSYSSWLFGIMWIMYHTCDSLVGMYYPWDCLMFEVGWTLPFFPTLVPLHLGVHVVELPIPILAWSVRFLLVRLLVGFGRFKFSEPSTYFLEYLYIKHFYGYLPMATWGGWLIARLPNWFHGLSMVFMFLSECVFPFGFFFLGWPRLVAVVSTWVLMFMIQFVSNFGYFNLLTAVLCVGALDLESSLWEQPALWDLKNVGEMVLVVFMVVVIIPAATLFSPLTSWVTGGGFYFATLDRVPFVSEIAAFLRFLQGTRMVHSYGVFPPTSHPAARWSFAYEGSEDGKVWKQYRYRLFITDTKSPPYFVSPHHPRFDHLVFYDAMMGVTGHNVLAALVTGNPYNACSDATLLKRTQARLLDGSSTVNALFAVNPFPDRPPRFVRGSLHRFVAAPLSHWWKTGEYWIETKHGVHFPPMERNSKEHLAVFQSVFRPPEVWIAESHIWRRRAETTSKPVTRTDLDTTFKFVATVRRLAAEFTSILPQSTSKIARIPGDVPQASDAVQVSSPKAFESASSIIDQGVATKVFTWRILRQVRGALRQLGYDDVTMLEVEESFGRVASLLLYRLERLCHRPSPSKQDLQNALQNWNPESKVDKDAVQAWPTWKQAFADLDEWLEPGKMGLMADTFRMGRWAQWLLLVGGHDHFTSLDLQSFIHPAPLAPQSTSALPSPSDFLLLFRPNLHPVWMSDENATFVECLFRYDGIAHAAQHGAINESNTRPHSYKAQSCMGPPVPGWMHLLGPLGRQSQLRAWDPLTKQWAPKVAVPTHNFADDGTITCIDDGIARTNAETKLEQKTGIIPTPPEDIRLGPYNPPVRIYGVPAAGPADGKVYAYIPGWFEDQKPKNLYL